MSFVKNTKNEALLNNNESSLNKGEVPMNKIEVPTNQKKYFSKLNATSESKITQIVEHTHNFIQNDNKSSDMKIISAE